MTWRAARTSLLAFLMLAALTVVASVAAAEEDGEDIFGGGAERGDTVRWDIENRVEDFGPTTGAGRDHDVSPEPENCAIERSVAHYDNEGNYLYSTWYCDAAYHCDGERIDDVYSGRIAGSDAGGAYGEYLDRLINGIAPFVPRAISDEFREILSDFILDDRLGPPVESLALPVFYYCRIGEGGPIEFGGGHPFDPRFSWDTTVGENYDLPGNVTRIIDGLQARLTASPPEVRAIPPLDGGRTFIRFPMWFWLDEPVVEDGLWTLSEGGTIRLQARILFERVEFDWGNGSIDCGLDDMQVWQPGLHPYDDRPVCHHIVDDLGDLEIRATVFYTVEQNVSIRPSTHVPFPETPWTPAAVGVLSAESVIGPIDVRELLALNVNEVLTAEG